MYACETMGGADSICSDKTGTLTMNKMVLTKIWNKQFYEIDYLAKEQNLSQLVSKSMENLFLEALCCNSSAELTPESGSKTEIAILEYLQKARIDYRRMREQVNFIKKNPFSSARKRMSVIVDTKHNGLPVKRLYIKGASEIIVQSLTHMHTYDDQKLKLGVKDIQEIERIISQMAKQSLRIICVAYLDLRGDEDLQKMNGKVYDIETQDLTFLGLFGIMDNLREGVKDAVTKCKQAGIKVRMVTGDNSETARAIAMNCGIIEQGDGQAIVIEGAEFMKEVGGVVCKNCTTELCKCAKSSNEAEKNGTSLRVDTLGNMSRFRQIYPQIAVMARSRPTDKYAMIIGLKECEHIVAVTGDGTNDAPALKKADVGFAMGKAGTQVAKDASAIILMEDNFSDIVKAVMWGRNIFQSIRKFLQFQLTVNVVAVGFTLISSALLKQDVLKPIQMLWVNLIMDSFASLALATEPPSEILLKDRPYSRSESIVTNKMIKHIIGQAIYQLAVILVLVFLAQEFIPEYADDYDDVIRDRIQEKIEEDSDFVFEQSSLYHPKYNTDYYPESLKIRSGRFLTVTSENDFEDIFNEFRVPSRHYTFIFNAFVFMQVFNFINSRKLNDEINVFANMCNNLMFVLIVFFIIILQIILVTFGSLAFSCYSYYGLTIQQWVISLIIGLVGLVVSFILKLIPEQHICPKTQNAESKTLDKKPSGILELRRGSSLRKKQSMHVDQPPIQDNHIQLIEK
ncbi:unnamed protein product (macronuclear) [Paramecium tetraurelia]|nr:uncharacterized protein GSPATT00005153001 [Paramecium tetraurelia]CAK60404.1 unnamed protein product [Paramecium tetraurelia]|eukprot:XP_001427802.1 hypothetical protein (macronuclear) [Paramecium tetraurelia strain d4-2]